MYSRNKEFRATRNATHMRGYVCIHRSKLSSKWSEIHTRCGHISHRKKPSRRPLSNTNTKQMQTPREYLCIFAQ